MAHVIGAVKANPSDDDTLIIKDSEDDDQLKQAKWSALKGLDGDATYDKLILAEDLSLIFTNNLEVVTNVE